MAAGTHCVDVLARSDEGVAIRWADEPSDRARSIEGKEAARIDALVDAVEEAEKRAGEEPAAVARARRELGRALHDLLDGPDRRLERWLSGAGGPDAPRRLVVRLLDEHDRGDPTHRALRWRWELLHDGSRPLFASDHPERPELVVQPEPRDPDEPAPLPTGAFRVLLMAFSPEGVTPVLDYEAEEERMLDTLGPFVEDGRVQLSVVEDGSLEALRRRLLRGPWDVVHLSGHGTIDEHGPKLELEDAVGRPEPARPRELVEVLNRAQRTPPLVVVSTCHSGAARSEVPALTASLVSRSVPAAIGWTRPVADVVAIDAARELYERLAAGDAPPRAVAFARGQLHEAAANGDDPTGAWGTLQLLSSGAPIPYLDHDRPPPERPASDQGTVYRFLGEQGAMKVLDRGFVGRRRELQRLLRNLRHGEDDGRRRAGALVWGMKGQGKSCLVGRAVERFSEEHPDCGLVVLHGVLREPDVEDAFQRLADRWDDDRASRLPTATSTASPTSASPRSGGSTAPASFG